LDLEREQPEKQYLDALKEVLRKYILDFDKKREDELTRQMIEHIKKKYDGLDQMVKSKEYSELIKEIDKFYPKEITPTIKSALYY
jgi:enoyl-[acyl-carrier-protein] reductase (NADH)